VKTIYLVCATGIATSTMLRVKIEAFLREHDVEASIYQYRVAELSPSQVKADLIVATTSIPDEIRAIAAVIDGIPLITGQGETETLHEILAKLQYDPDVA